jgi:TldD protein
MIAREPTLARLAIAQDLLLSPYGLEPRHLRKALGEILVPGVDDADLYFQYTRAEGWSLEEGIVKTGSFSIDQGVGVRAVSGEKTAFAYSDDLSWTALLDAAQSVRAIGAQGQSLKAKVGARKVAKSRSLYAGLDPIATLDSTEKVALLEKVERLAKAKDPRVVQVMAGLASEYDVVLIARADGTLAADVRPLARLSVTVIAEQGGRREAGGSGGGGRFGLDRFDDELVQQYVDEAVQAALTNLESRPAPAGQMTVVLGPGWPGVLLHEAVGHGLEGDFNRKGSSAFSGRIGQRVAAKGVTVLDDGTLADRRGSLNVDDEGCTSQRNVLIEDGILKGYIQDSLNARLMGVAPTGNGRRESYAHLPLPRMTNTYMLGGDKDPRRSSPASSAASTRPTSAAARSTSRAASSSSARIEAYWVENGKLMYPVKGATIVGNGPDLLEDHDDRQRHGARQRRGHLRQGRPERAGRRRPADAAHRGPDRRRHGLTGSAGFTLIAASVENHPVSCAILDRMKANRFYFAYFWFSSVTGGRES